MHSHPGCSHSSPSHEKEGICRHGGDRLRRTGPNMIHRPLRPCMLAASLLSVLLLPIESRAADWPMHRYDAGRSAASPQTLAAELHLHWVRQLPPLRPAWPDQAMMQFDAAYAPVVAGKMLFVGSPLTDTVTAYHTETGAENWRFTTDGPVRFAPVVWEDRLYFVSDDGHLYCLDAA